MSIDSGSGAMLSGMEAVVSELDTGVHQSSVSDCWVASVVVTARLAPANERPEA